MHLKGASLVPGAAPAAPRPQTALVGSISSGFRELIPSHARVSEPITSDSLVWLK